jgi:hypothetical protein
LNYAVWLDEDIYDNPDTNDCAEYFAENAEWLVKRGDAYGFAAKGGNNNEHHNHNDVGSFIFAKDGKQLLVDLGPGKYTKQYFRNDTRYSHVECSSLGHSVPFFGECVQKTGKEYRATSIEYNPGFFALDIANAYDVPDLKSLKREFTLSDDSVSLTDTFDYVGEESITERFVSFIKPEICDGYVAIDSASIIYSLGEPTVSSVVDSKKRNVYFIDFKLPANTQKFTVIIK